MNEDLCEVVITAPDAEWLGDFARNLVANRLCAAAHEIGSIHTHYWWRGELHTENEGRVVLHTRVALLPAIIERTRKEHSFDVPCVIATPITAGNPDYLDWIVTETRER